MKKSINNNLKSLGFMIMLYLFFSLLNWTFKTNEWGNLSLFVFAIFGVIIILEEFNSF
jgi:hypothetical protein